MKTLSKELYEKLHNQNLCPLDIIIDSNLFYKEIKKYQQKFKKWGDLHWEFPRYALPIVNQTGSLEDSEDASCWPLDRWNFCLKYPEYKYQIPNEKSIEVWEDFYRTQIKLDETFVLEPNFKIKTDAYYMKCLEPLHVFDNFLYRSIIFKWDYSGHFKKHVDTFHNTGWLRLWGTLNSDSMILRYKKGDKMVEENNIESGRIYLHDSIIEHEALAFRDDVYQFFIALDIDSYDLIEKLKL